MGDPTMGIWYLPGTASHVVSKQGFLPLACQLRPEYLAGIFPPSRAHGGSRPSGASMGEGGAPTDGNMYAQTMASVREWEGYQGNRMYLV